MNFRQRQEAVIAENVFPTAYVKAWARRGVCPPPLHGSPHHMSSVILTLANRDRWDLDGAPLTVSDEQGVEIQRARCQAQVKRALSSAVEIPGKDCLAFPEAQAAATILLLGTWPDQALSPEVVPLPRCHAPPLSAVGRR
jgi:hypothetical protein